MNAPSPLVQDLHSVAVAQRVAEHEESFLGFTAPAIVALSMIVVLLIIWRTGGFRKIGAGLDTKIATIRRQLDEAAALRAEAEAMKADYQQKTADAKKEAQAILENAKAGAVQLVAKAKEDADLLIARRGKMAEDKIAAA